MTSFPRTFLRNARIIDGITDTPLVDHCLVFAQGVITWCGPTSLADAPAPEDVVVDATGATVLPGFIDTHVHLSADGDLNPAAKMHDPPSLTHYRAVRHLSQTLDAGITTVRDLSGVDYGTVAAVREGLVRGPDIIAAIRAVGPTAGHSDTRLLSVGFGEGTLQSALVDSVSAARRMARELIRAGAGVLKVMATGGVWSPRDAPEHVGLREKEMRAIVEEASNRDMHVAAHAQGTEGIKNALRAGVRSIEHGYLIDQEGIDLLQQHEAWLVPTLTTALTPPDPSHATHYALEKKKRVQGALEQNISKAISEGVKIALGTDSGVVPHGHNLREVRHLVELGLSPMDAIRAGTSGAAELLQMEDSRGSIRPGLRADLVVVTCDPLEEPWCLEDPSHITQVFSAGVRVK